ncbi:uncharacterized protein LOC143034097 [Oratosquilla oratoria]|uniref:uncharacterized protein LOC143034097 n=1 Tax=Oratosquilla oratoria TaxID=337810 RepID=UPI003F771F06
MILRCVRSAPGRCTKRVFLFLRIDPWHDLACISGTVSHSLASVKATCVSPLLRHLHPLLPSKVVNGAYLTPHYRYSDFSMAKRSLTEEEYLQALFVSSDEEEPYSDF